MSTIAPEGPVNYSFRQALLGVSYRGHASFTIPVGESRMLQLDTGNKIIVLLSTVFTARAGDLSIELIEDPDTVTDGDTPLTFYNTDRNLTDSSAFVVRPNPTNVTGGTVIALSKLLGEVGVGHSRGGDRFNTGFEWILKANTTYIRKLTNNNSESADVVVEASWAEKDQLV